MKSKKAFRQKHRLFLINRDFQMRYTGAAVMVGLLSTLLTTSLILYPLFQFEILRIPRFLPIPILVVMAFAAVLNIALVGMMGILLTHRMAGPMYALVRQFRRVEEGRWYGQLKIRDGDDLRYVVRNFNAMLDALNKMTQMDLEKLKSMRQIMEDRSLREDERHDFLQKEINLLEDRLHQRLYQDLEKDNDQESIPHSVHP